jgi:hypothetical protein
MLTGSFSVGGGFMLPSVEKELERLSYRRTLMKFTWHERMTRDCTKFAQKGTTTDGRHSYLSVLTYSALCLIRGVIENSIQYDGLDRTS